MPEARIAADEETEAAPAGVALNGHGHHPSGIPVTVRMESVTQLLYPLCEFYADAGRPLPEAVQVAGEEVPEPYRQLLVHAHDMTPTLEGFHRERIHLRPLERRLAGDTMRRQVVLTLNGSLKPVEYGAIAIHCQHFPEAARILIVESRCPLGTILADYQIEHLSRPQAFFRVTADDFMHEALGLAGYPVLYGRRNVLLTPDGRVLADVLEILPAMNP